MNLNLESLTDLWNSKVEPKPREFNRTWNSEDEPKPREFNRTWNSEVKPKPRNINRNETLKLNRNLESLTETEP